jgi:hypothetical protein
MAMTMKNWLLVLDDDLVLRKPATTTIVHDIFSLSAIA